MEFCDRQQSVRRLVDHPSQLSVFQETATYPYDAVKAGKVYDEFYAAWLETTGNAVASGQSAL